MDRQEAIDNLLDHYENPRHKGTLPDADAVVPGGNPNCGDVVTIYLKVDQQNDRIEQVTFDGHGCAVSQAAASILTEMAQQAPLKQIEEMDFNTMMDILGRDVVKTRPRCATLALGTLKAAIIKYRRDHKQSIGDDGLDRVQLAELEAQCNTDDHQSPLA